MFIPKKTRIKLYNTLTLPTLFTKIKIGPLTRITAAEMKYMRTAGYT
jgi:hypothetical protein